MPKKSSINDLISSISSDHKQISLELAENCLKNEYTLIQKDCRIINSMKSFTLDLPVDIDSSRILSYTIYEMLKRKEFNEKYISYDIESLSSVKTVFKHKSKIIIVGKYTTLKVWKEEFKLWGFPIHFIISNLNIKKIDDITEDIIVIKDSIAKYLNIDNFFDTSYQIYGFIGENKSDRNFCNLISPFIKSKVNISDQNSYSREYYYITGLKNSKRKIPIEDRFKLDVDIDVKYKIS